MNVGEVFNLTEMNCHELHGFECSFYRYPETVHGALEIIFHRRELSRVIIECVGVGLVFKFV